MSIALATTALLGTVACSKPANSDDTSTETSVHDRVVESGIIKAAYPPGIGMGKDPATGEMYRDVYVDTLEAAAALLDLQVEWTEEVAWYDFDEKLNEGHFDIIAGIDLQPYRLRSTLASRPLHYSQTRVYVRSDDERFASGDRQTILDQINSPNIRISSIEGETSDIIPQSLFPDAELLPLPLEAPIFASPREVAEGRADVTFSSTGYVNGYLQENPGSLHELEQVGPVAYPGAGYVMKAGEIELKGMVDGALDFLLDSGYVDQKLDEYSSSDLPLQRPFVPSAPAQSGT